MSDITIYDNSDPIDELSKALRIISNHTRLRILFIIKDIKYKEKISMNSLNKKFHQNCKKQSSEKDLSNIESNEEKIFEYLECLVELTNSSEMPSIKEIKKELKNLYKTDIDSEKIKNHKKNLEDKKQVIDVRRLQEELFNRYEIGIQDPNLRNHLNDLRKHKILSKHNDFITRTIRGPRKVNAYQSALDDFASIIFDLTTLNMNSRTVESINTKNPYNDSEDITNEFELRVLNESGIEKYIHINNMEDGETLRIGRKDESYENNEEKLLINLPSFYKGVSRISKPHAWLKFQNGKYYIIDNETRSRTYINTKKIQPNTEINLKNNDRIHLGSGKRAARMIFSIK